MKKAYILILVVLVLPIMANAVHVQDLNLTDQMSVINQWYPSPGIIAKYNVTEDITDNTIIPYPGSHDGWAIVNQEGGYFDKIVTLNIVDFNNPVNFVFEFVVTNNSGRTWSDFHFEFYHPTDFNVPVDIPYISIYSDKFDQPWHTGANTASSINFFTDGAGVAPGDNVLFEINLDITNPIFPKIPYPDGQLDEFGIGVRQIATTTPVPGALLLLASGVIGLIGFRRQKMRPFKK